MLSVMDWTSLTASLERYGGDRYDKECELLVSLNYFLSSILGLPHKRVLVLLYFFLAIDHY